LVESKTRLYRIWSHMKNRCNSPNSDNYKRYGYRGIKVCDEWNNSFKSFKTWALANGYDDNLTLDRKDNNGNYEPDNCRWITLIEQQKNRSNSTIFNGKVTTLTELSQLTGIPRTTLSKRLRKGRW